MIPWTVTPQPPLSMGIRQAGILSGLPCPPPGDLPNPGIEPRSPALPADSFPSEPPGKHINFYWSVYSVCVCFFLLSSSKKSMRRGTAYLNHMVFRQCLTHRSITSIWWMNKWRRGEKEVVKEEALRWKVWQWMRIEWLLTLVLANAKHLWHYRRSAPARLSHGGGAEQKQSGRPPSRPS